MKRLKFLVVDDEAGIRELIGDILSTFGHTVIPVDDFDLGVDAVDSEEFDVMITDYMMPNGVGSVLASIARQVRPGLQVIGMTGDEANFENIRQQFLGAGAFGVMKKPFTIAGFVTFLRGHLPQSFPEKAT